MDDIKIPKTPKNTPHYIKAMSRVEEASAEQYIKGLIKQRRRNFLNRFGLYRALFDTTLHKLFYALAITVLIVFVALPILQSLLDHKIYAISDKEASVLLKTNDYMAKKLVYDGKSAVYNFNQDYSPRNPGQDLGAGGSLIKAKIYQDAKDGLQITDPVNNVDFTLKPLFQLGHGQQQQNRIVYPTFMGNGHLVYTAGAIGIKEDITLQHYVGDKLSLNYELELGDQFAAKLEPSGAIGIYGSSLPLNGSISTGSDKDAALLKKARQKAVKDKLLFELPVPKIKEGNGKTSAARAHFMLDGDRLTVVAEHLKSAVYPISIDPTITATSGSTGNGLFSFDANIETNVYVDLASNNFIERSPLTGGNLLSWTGSSSAAAAHFLGGSLVYAGTLYVIGGASTTTTGLLTGSNYVEQAKINSDGTVGTFSSGNATGLPAGGIARFQLLTYNGYMYIVDGITTGTSTAASGTISNAVYYTRITSESFGAFSNGAQLKNWSTATNTPSNAVYDYGATVYNGVIYVAGGYNSGGTVQTAVTYNVISPSGNLGASWQTATALSAGRAGLGMQSYNGHLYILGGNSGNVNTTTLTATTFYASIASDGSIADNLWKPGSNLVSSDGSTTQVMENLGAQFTMIYNGYLYVTGACGAVNTSSACTSVLNYTQLAQVNADGSLGTFFPNDFQSGGTLARIGTPTFGYNGNMYSIAGCSVMPTTSVSCSTTSLTSNYASVNGTTTATASTGVGDVSNNRNPTTLPTALYGQSTVVLNGFLYLLGGCTTNSCNGTGSTRYATSYATINSDGSLGSWTTDSTVANGLHTDGAFFNCNPSFDNCGLGGAAATTYNGYMYVIGGYDGGAYSGAVYYQKPNASTGAIGAWSKSGNTINNAAIELGAFAYNGALYALGGCTGGNAGLACTGGNYFTQVQKSVIGAAGAPAAWSATGGTPTQLQLPTVNGGGRAAFGLALSGNYVYVAGGIQDGGTNSDNQLATVIRAKIDSSGNIAAVSGGAWQATTATMTAPRRRTVAAVVNGYLYVVAGHDASANAGAGATYGDIQIGKIDMSSGGSGNIVGDATNKFTQSPTGAVTPRWNPAVAFSAGNMYITGGCTAGPPPGGCTTIGTIDEAFVVYNADGLGVNTWNAPTHYYSSNANGDTNLANRLGAGTAVYNGYLYVAGGCTTFVIATLACSATANDTAYAPIKADGTLGTWVSGGTFTTATGFGQLVALNGYLYYMGGQTGAITTSVSNMYYSQINSSTGAPGAWTATNKALADTGSAHALTQFSATVYANRIFVAGGCSGNPCTNVQTVYVSPALASGGDITTTWTATTSFTVSARREISLVSAGAFLYVVGGFDGTNYLADVQVATPNTSTGLISSWTTIKEIPYAQAGMSAVGANGYLFVFGGRNGVAATSCSKNSYFAAVNGNGTVGEWIQTPNQLNTARFGAGTGFSNGYFYVTGGHNCTSIFTSNVLEQSGQLSEAIHATYTRYVDFGTDATLRQLYVLGTNAQISSVDIDIWKIIVKTSTSVNNVWGQKYTTTLTGLGTGPNYGTPITFQALDASGVNQGASEFWDITFDIDQAQSFNFPDTTQPQITKYDFYFSPGPAKRLRDGKTFVNEQQTNLDAHP